MARPSILLRVPLPRARGARAIAAEGGEGRSTPLSVPIEVPSLAWIAKRAIDVVLATAALTIALPLIVLVVVAIMIDSPGSPFFIHRRLGRWGNEFPLVKFRTMVPDAEDRRDEYLGDRGHVEWGRAQKLRLDPRVTRVGRILRRCSLDELPQLVNVLRGEMSLVGPRPVIREEIERFGSHASLVLSVRPGLTGLWAVSGRSDLSYGDRVALEARYVRDWSLALDVAILVRTIPKVLGCTGAY